MSPRSSRPFAARVRRRAWAAPVAVLLAACSGGSGGDGGGEPAADPAPPTAVIATVEEQGSFSTPCPLSHSSPDDPIVHHDHAGASHLHDFFGATTTTAHSDAESLLAGDTTCRSVADKTAYWAPALLADGQPLVPEEMQAYYRVPIGADATQVEAPPNGLEMIAGDAASTAPQDPAVVAWSCGLADVTSPVPTPCEQSPFLLLRLRFDPCWDGENLGSDDHRSHLSGLGADGSCPTSHPVLIPQLQVDIRYPSTPAATALTLASGPTLGGHGDALVAWDRDHVEREVRICLHANRSCDVTSETTRLNVPPEAES